MRFLMIISISFISGLLMPPMALGAQPVGTTAEIRLDFDFIKKLYNDGELERARIHLETFLKNHKNDAHREERVFANKYLGVIHATQAGGKSRAEAFFNQALDLSPNISIDEMYVSAPIESLFVQIQHKHQEKLNRQARFDEFGNPIQQEGSSKNQSEKTFVVGSPNSRSDSSKRSIPRPTRIKSAESHSVWPWVLAGGAVAAGVGTYLVLSQSDKSSDNTLPVGTKPEAEKR